MKQLAVMMNNQAAEIVTDFSIVERWINFSQVKPASEKSYRKGLKNFANFLRDNGIENPAQATREILLAYREFLKKYSPSTANLYLTSTKLFYEFLHVEGYVTINPALHIKGFKTGTTHKKDAIAAADNAKIIKSIDTSTLQGKRNLAFYTLASVAGLRTCEIARANIENLVTRGGKVYLYVVGKGHDCLDACVNVPAPVVEILKDYLNARGTVPADAPLFASVSHRNYGGRLTTGSISRIIKGIFRANGIDTPRISAHSLRHTFCTVALKNGATLRQVQQAARHSDISVTTRYLHDMDRDNNPAETLAAAAFGLSA